jgi:hypothetical protein
VLKETLSGGTYTESLLASLAVNLASGAAIDASGNVYISDTGNNLAVELQQAAVNFGAVNAGSASGEISLIFTFDTGGTLGGRQVLTQGVAGLDFDYAGTGSCRKETTYAAGDICTINVIFRPPL